MEQDKIWDYYQTSGCSDVMFSPERARYFARWLKPGKKVLNIGIGNGELERFSLSKGVEIYSLDPSEQAIEKIRSVKGYAERAKAGRAEAIPFPSNSFDIVVMSEVLEHLDEDIFDQALNEVFLVLRPGGLFMGSTHIVGTCVRIR